MNDLEDVRAGVIDQTELKQRALQIHSKCVQVAKSLREKQREFAINLSYMRSDKLYLLLGYTGFHEYCEAALSLKSSQADKYAAVGIFLRRMEFNQSTGSEVTNCNLFNDLGIEKMAAIASLDLPDFKYISDNYDLVNMSSREVNKAVKQFRLDEKQKENHGFMGNTADYQKTISESVKEYNAEVVEDCDLPEVPQQYFQYYQLLLELRSLLNRLSELKTPYGIYFPIPNWLMNVDNFIHTLENSSDDNLDILD